MAFEHHFLAVGEVAGFFRRRRQGSCWRCGGLDGCDHGDLAGGIGGCMAGGGGAEVPTPIVAVEVADRVVELVGGVFRV